MTDVLERIGERVRLQAMVNGRARYQVSAIRTDDSTLLVTDLLNLSSAKAREVLANQVAEEYRKELGGLALELAHEVAGHRLSPPKSEPAQEEFAPWPESVRAEWLLDAISNQIQRYVILPRHEVTALSLWVLHTFVTDVTDYSPYIWVHSPVRECGKSTLLELLHHLAHKAQLTGGITAAALYRRIARLAPTMLLDELDSRLRGDGGENLRGVLNTGFHSSGRVTICVGDEHEERDFSTYCPKVLAGIGRLWDTVTSRSIPIRMERATRDELAKIRKIRGDSIAAECLDLRRQSLRWAADAKPALRDAEPDVPEDLGARQADVWRPLLAIAEQGGDSWASRARAAALALYGIGEEEGDWGLLLLEDVRALLEQSDSPAILTTTLLEALTKREDRPWPEYRHDRPITARGVASLLGRFRVKPTTVRVGEDRGKGYRAEDLAPVFRKYLKKQGPLPEILSVTSVTNEPGACPVTDVTDRKQGTGPLFAESELLSHDEIERRAIALGDA
jgi:hypothetical protein